MEMQSQLSLLHLSSRMEAIAILQVRRCLSRCAPVYLSTKFATRDSIHTNYPPLMKLEIFIKTPHTNLYWSSFEYYGAKIYNDLPSDFPDELQEVSAIVSCVTSTCTQRWRIKRPVSTVQRNPTISLLLILQYMSQSLKIDSLYAHISEFELFRIECVH